MNIAIATKEYGNGKICIISDRISGFRNGHGEQPSQFYTNLFKYIGNNDIVSIGIVDSINLNNYTYLDKYNVSYELIDLQDISTQFIQYDLIYFIGLPEKVDVDCSNAIEFYVNNGGGIIIEVPNKNGNINVLSSIENIYCNYERPTFSKAYWTESGLNSELYDSELYIAFLTTLDQSYFSTWNILMNDVQVEYKNSLVKQIDNIEIIGSCISNFGMSYTVAYQNGILELKERLSSSSTSSNSSSSADDTESWDICNDIVAQYKLNENYDTSFIWDSTGNFNNIGELYDNTQTKILTKNHSVIGKINRAINFSNNMYVKTKNNTDFNFTNGIHDTPFSVSMWINWRGNNGYMFLVSKTGVWSIYTANGWFLGLALHNGANAHTFCFQPLSTPYFLHLNQWDHIVVTYDTTNANMYINGQNYPLTGDVYTGTYVTMANLNNPLYIGNESEFSGSGFIGYIDNIIIANKVFSSIEIEGLYNHGYGTEECHGIYEYTSSSSSSNSSSSSTSSISSFSSMSKSSSSSSTFFMSSSSSQSSSSSSTSSSNSSLSSISSNSSSSTYDQTSSSSSTYDQTSSSSSSHSSNGSILKFKVNNTCKQ